MKNVLYLAASAKRSRGANIVSYPLFANVIKKKNKKIENTYNCMFAYDQIVNE